MRTNLKTHGTAQTHEGAVTHQSNPLKELRRAIMASMLWESTFYEAGDAHAKRVAELCKQVGFTDLAAAAVDARERFKLRHAPLFLVREAIRYHKGRQVGDLICRVIQRPDELGELLSLYWRDNPQAPLASQLKIGLARALKKFNTYQLAKWSKDGAVKIRDVLFLSHAKPRDDAQAALFKQLTENTLETPDTWEVALSGGADKGEAFTRLLAEKKLGALALLRNLRGMLEAGVSEDVIRQGLADMSVERVLPFRFVTAARYAPRLEDALEGAMLKCLDAAPKLAGKTAILVDHSGSMFGAKISAKSEIDLFDAACALAMLVRETCDRARVFAFADSCVEVPPRRGFALAQAIKQCMPSGGTRLGIAVNYVYTVFPECERLIVITDEQSADRPQHPRGRGYIINVGTYQNGIAYGPWVSIDGWSEAVLDFIREYETDEEEAAKT
jgi:60 kDa SS-A/Ro ribonucleoprotein